MLVSKIPKALTANNDKQQTNYNSKVTSVKLYIVMYCLKEQRLNRELTIGFSKYLTDKGLPHPRAPAMGNLGCEIDPK